jgi:hypothetical protein
MAKLGDRVAKTIADRVKKMSGHVDVGFMENATYPDGTPVATVAFWNNYGHGGPFPSPPRPFFSDMIAKEKPTWGKKVIALSKIEGMDGDKILALMGEDIQGALIQSIRDLTAPALSRTTLILRSRFGNNPQNIKFDDVLAAQRAPASEVGATGTQAKPLIWTGHMINSTAYRVIK